MDLAAVAVPLTQPESERCHLVPVRVHFENELGVGRCCEIVDSDHVASAREEVWFCQLGEREWEDRTHSGWVGYWRLNPAAFRRGVLIVYLNGLI
jgi:hypothetical protein